MPSLQEETPIYMWLTQCGKSGNSLHTAFTWEMQLKMNEATRVTFPPLPSSQPSLRTWRALRTPSSLLWTEEKAITVMYTHSDHKKGKDLASLSLKDFRDTQTSSVFSAMLLTNSWQKVIKRYTHDTKKYQLSITNKITFSQLALSHEPTVKDGLLVLAS